MLDGNGGGNGADPPRYPHHDSAPDSLTRSREMKRVVAVMLATLLFVGAVTPLLAGDGGGCFQPRPSPTDVRNDDDGDDGGGVCRS